MKIYGKGNSKAQDAFKLWLKQGFLKDVQLSIRTKSGESRNVLLNVSSILGDIEGESLAIGVQHDITERKEAQAKLETVISQAKPVILVVGDDRKISMCSGQDVATLGISSERALGKTVEDVFGELRGLSTLLDKAFAGERVTELFESEKITWEITISPMTLGGEVNAVVVSAADVTEQRKSEMRLLALDRLKSRFITALTHVTRTPLNRIRWSLESIKSGDFGDISPEESNLIQQALDSESEVLHVIQNMNLTLDVERDSLSLETMPASLVSIVRSVKNLYENNPNFEGVEWSEEIPNEDIKPINLDTEKMRIALTAIIDNAVRYPGEGKHLVTVKVNGVGEKTRCSVKDNGIGIPGSEQAYIFDRFFRASNAHLKHPNGMGLGLHITKAIIEAHGGEMGFNSEEGLGTEVWFELPHKE